MRTDSLTQLRTIPARRTRLAHRFLRHTSADGQQALAVIQLLPKQGKTLTGLSYQLGILSA
ncbi:hypothetical protein [Alteromonas antoniana]|uniref:hypothetical protein n=1 Tax=Alteromonas antoniana TaxID=2803813 RepID=UPI001C45BC9A|nr:hypothetical protein [Alteromonas antoniana]